MLGPPGASPRPFRDLQGPTNLPPVFSGDGSYAENSYGWEAVYGIQRSRITD